MPNISGTKVPFLNFTNIDDSEAKDLVGNFKTLMHRAESDRRPNLERAERAMKIWKNEFWDEDDLEIFEQMDVYPHQIPEARAPLNNLVSQQRNSRYSFDILPLDNRSFDRFQRGRDEFVEQNIDDFDSVKEAQEYYEEFYDDEYASALTTYHDFIRNKNETRHLESEVFENGLITGLHFLKTIYKDGHIHTDSRSQRSMVYDQSSVKYDLSDSEYIGEVHMLYKHDIIEQYPQHKDAIENHFTRTNNFIRHGMKKTDQWKQYYEFSSGRADDLRIKVVELWYKDIEDRIALIDHHSGDDNILKFDLEEEEIFDILLKQELERLEKKLAIGELEPEFFDRSPEEIKRDVSEMIDERYDIIPTTKSVWNKVVFTYDAIFEFMRSPLPHESHPYTPYFAQFTDGWNTGIIDDVHDVLLALNKAVAFREVLLAHSAKGALIVDRNTITRSNYDIDDVKNLWTQVGAVIDLDLQGNRRLQDVFQEVNTMAQGLTEINVVIQDLERRLYRIMGVNEAQLGMVGNEASGSQVRQRIVQGQSNNGRIYDNFNRTLQLHTHKKVIPLAMFDLYEERPKAIRNLSDNHKKWLRVRYDDDFELFSEAIMTGKYQTKLVTKDPDKQSNSVDSAMLFELASAGVINIETAFEFADRFPNSHEIIKRDKEIRRKKQREEASQQVKLQQLQQILLENPNLSGAMADEIMKELQSQILKEQIQQDSRESEAGKGLATIQGEAQKLQQQDQLERANV